MYKVSRKGNRVLIQDWKGETIYAADDDFYVMYETELGKLELKRVDELTDVQLLRALAQAKRFQL